MVLPMVLLELRCCWCGEARRGEARRGREGDGVGSCLPTRTRCWTGSDPCLIDYGMAPPRPRRRRWQPGLLQATFGSLPSARIQTQTDAHTMPNLNSYYVAFPASESNASTALRGRATGRAAGRAREGELNRLPRSRQQWDGTCLRVSTLSHQGGGGGGIPALYKKQGHSAASN